MLVEERLDVFDQLQMSAVNIEHKCEGPMYTYVSLSGCSVVDYIFLDSTLLQDVKNVKVIDQNQENTAYRLPDNAEIILTQVLMAGALLKEIK